jgi:choline dehydrogenase
MAWGNAVLSENQNDVEACVTERGYEAEIPTYATAESTASALFSTVASRGCQAMEGTTANDGFGGIVGTSGALREVLDLVRMVAPAQIKREKGKLDVVFANAGITNQQKLTGQLRPHYDFIVCGSGSSGSVVARRLAENSDVSVLLLEAGGGDDVPSVTESHRWIENFGTERDWSLVSQPNPNLKGRSFPVNMGKLLGGGSSINAMIWARGHKTDWDFFASESGDPAWNYESVLEFYRRIEDWQSAPDPQRRGTGGLVSVQSAPNPNPIAPAMVEGARSIGIPTFKSNNGSLMEGDGGASIADVRVREGKRLSVFRTYAFPYMDRPNLTVLTHALVTRLVLKGRHVSGVEIAHNGNIQRIDAGVEVIL